MTTADQPVTRGTLLSLIIALNRFGMTNRDQALGCVSCILGRPVTSRKTLTGREASKVLDHLDHHLEPTRKAATA